MMAAFSRPRPRAADGSTARRWAPGIVRLKSRRRSLKRSITTPSALPTRPADSVMMIQMRELVSEVDPEVCDIRGVRESHSVYDPESYAASQPFGEALRRAAARGIVYASVRRPSGTNLVVYRRSLLPPVIEGDHFDYRWTGGPTSVVLKLTGVGAR